MKKTTITLRFYDRRKGYIDKEWSAYKTDVPGLSVCKRPYYRWNNYSTTRPEYNCGHWEAREGQWQLIHETSGRPLHYIHVRFPTREAAIMAAQALPAIDWTQERDTIMAIEGIMAVTTATIHLFSEGQ